MKRCAGPFSLVLGCCAKICPAFFIASPIGSFLRSSRESSIAPSTYHNLLSIWMSSLIHRCTASRVGSTHLSSCRVRFDLGGLELLAAVNLSSSAYQGFELAMLSKARSSETTCKSALSFKRFCKIFWKCILCYRIIRIFAERFRVCILEIIRKDAHHPLVSKQVCKSRLRAARFLRSEYNCTCHGLEDWDNFPCIPICSHCSQMKKPWIIAKVETQWHQRAHNSACSVAVANKLPTHVPRVRLPAGGASHLILP